MINAVLLGILGLVSAVSTTVSTVKHMVPVETSPPVEASPLDDMSSSSEPHMALASTTVSTMWSITGIPVTATSTNVTTTTTEPPSASPTCEMLCVHVIVNMFLARKLCWCLTPEERKAASSAAPRSTSPSKLLLLLVALVSVVLASDWITAIARTETTTTVTEMPTVTVVGVPQVEKPDSPEGVGRYW